MFELYFKYANDFIKDEKLIKEIDKLRKKYPEEKDNLTIAIKKIKEIINEYGEFVRFSKIEEVLERTNLFQKERVRITPKEMMTMITQYIMVDNLPEITQEWFDLMVLECVKDNSKEKAWRLACSFHKSKDITKIEDYFLKEGDAYYLGELLSVTYADDLESINNLINKIINTKNKKLLKKLLELNYLDNVISKKQLEQINIWLVN